jgi:membrane protein
MSDVGPFIKAVIAKWRKDRVPQLSAALAYYTVFSLAPLIVILIAISGIVLDKASVQTFVLAWVADALGEKGAIAIQGVIAGITRPASGIIATIVSLGTLIFGSSRVFAQLREALDTIWEVEPQTKKGLVKSVKNRFFSFMIVILSRFDSGSFSSGKCGPGDGY